MFIRTYMELGGGPSETPDPPEGSEPEQPSPGPEAPRGRDAIEFHEQTNGNRMAAPKPPAPTTEPAGPFYRAGDREFRTKEDLDRFFAEQNERRRDPEFDPREFEDRVTERFNRQFEDFGRMMTERLSGLGGRPDHTPPKEQENPYDPDVNPREFFGFEMNRMRDHFAAQTEQREREWEDRLAEMNEGIGDVRTTIDQDRLNRDYLREFGIVAKELRIQEEFKEDIEAKVASDPRVRDDLRNVKQLAAEHWGRLKSMLDKRDSATRAEMERRAAPLAPSVHRSASPNLMRRGPGESEIGYEEPGKLGGAYSTYNRIARRLGARGGQ